MKIDKNTTFKDFAFYTNLFRLTESQVGNLFKRLETKGRPVSILDKPVPMNLNDLTYGQLAEIQLIKTTEDMLFVPLCVILEIEKHELLELKAFDVIGFMLFVKKELLRIAKLFSDIKYKPSPEELQAGINNINNGLFGSMDWYAKRMGITDHQEVEQVPWVRVYKCMAIDNTNAIFEKRLREIYSKKK